MTQKLYELFSKAYIQSKHATSKLPKYFSIPFSLLLMQVAITKREAVIGLDIRWNLLYVVHIEREENIIRIISARKATRQERAEYEN